MKPLLQWMDEGDPDLVPVVMADARSTAASYFGVPVRSEGVSASFTDVVESPVTPEMIAQCGKETGIHFHASLGAATPWDFMEFMDGVEVSAEEQTDASGAVRRRSTIRTPAGEMHDVFVTPGREPACWEEHFVKSEADLPAFACFIETAAAAAASDARAREKVTAKFRTEAARWPSTTVLYATMGVPTFALTCNLYMDPSTAFYLLADQTSLMERLFAAQARMNAVFIESAADAGADFVLGAINGLELYSPAIYEQYFIPQARDLHEAAHAHGMRGWVHTCGKMNQLIDVGTYERMNVDVLESLSHPPLGDVDSLQQARARIGDGIATRGAVNVDLFYDDDLARIRARTRKVIEETRGLRHMIGDTNDSFPPYPRDNILAMVEEVHKSGLVLPAQVPARPKEGE